MVDPPPAGDPVSFTGQPLAPTPLPSPHYACLRWCLPRASQAVLLKWRDVDTCWGLGVTMQPVSTVHSAVEREFPNVKHVMIHLNPDEKR